MKKITLFFVILLVCCVFCSPMVASAETVEEPAVTDENAPIEDNSPIEEGENHTLLGRVWEYIESNSEVITTAVFGFGVFACQLWTNLTQKKKLKALAENVAGSVTNTSLVSKSQNSVVDVVNSLVVAYNGLKESYDRHQGEEDDRNHAVVTLVALCMTMLEIQMTTYTNNKNLPQGIKDLCLLKYSNCLKTIEADERLKAIYDSIKQAFAPTPEIASEVISSEEDV